MLRTVIKQFEMKNADEDEVLRLMPPPMRRSTIKFVYSDLVSKMLLFKGLNEAVTMEMLVALRMPRDSCWHLGCIVPRVPAMMTTLEQCQPMVTNHCDMMTTMVCDHWSCGQATRPASM